MRRLRATLRPSGLIVVSLVGAGALTLSGCSSTARQSISGSPAVRILSYDGPNAVAQGGMIQYGIRASTSLAGIRAAFACGPVPSSNCWPDVSGLPSSSIVVATMLGFGGCSTWRSIASQQSGPSALQIKIRATSSDCAHGQAAIGAPHLALLSVPSSSFAGAPTVRIDVVIGPHADTTTVSLAMP